MNYELIKEAVLESLPDDEIYIHFHPFSKKLYKA